MPTSVQEPLMTLVPEPTCGTEDRRIIRSKKALRLALIALMEERGFDGFTVNDLCERADLNRGTFYNHFKDKEDLLVTFEDEVMVELAALQGKMEGLNLADIIAYQHVRRPLPFLVELFDYLRQERGFLHAVLGPGGDVRFGPQLRDSVCTHLIQGVLHEKYRHEPTAFVNYYVAFFASAYLGIITCWIETGMQENSEEMALIAMRLFLIRPGESIKL
jgi:AcrR family transcriptional regulator